MPASFAHSAPTIVTISPVAIPATNAKYSPISLGLLGSAEYGIIGQGGWQIIDRPKMVAATQWFDRSPYSLKFSAIIDHSITAPVTPGAPILSTSTSVENDCEQLELWLEKVDATYSPPVLSITGPVPGIKRLYVLYGLSFRDALRDQEAGYRIQQTVDITLYEYSPPLGNTLNQYSYAPSQTFAEQQNSSDITGTQQFIIYTVKDGDTLTSISNNFYGNPSMTQQIKTFNGIRDDSVLSIMSGQVLKMPRLTATGAFQ
jgi:LysM repeat protein